MNRQRKRELERKYGTGFAMQKYRDEVMQQGIDKGIHDTISMVLYMTGYTLNYKLGFGKKRLIRIMTDIYNNIDSYRTGQLDPNDYKEIVNMMNQLGFYVK